MIFSLKHIGQTPAAILAAILLWPLSIQSEEAELAAGTVMVDIQAEPSVAPWMAAAFEQTITREILGYQHIRVRDKRKLQIRADQSSQLHWLLSEYGKAGVDIVLRGRLFPTRLHYEIFECWTPSRAEKGSFGLGLGTTMTRLKQQILRAAAPFLRKGGLLEDKLYIALRRLFPARQPDVLADEPGEPTKNRYLGYAAFAVAVFFSAPIFLLVFVIGRKRLPKQGRLHFLRWSIPVVLFATGFGIHCWTDWLSRLWIMMDSHGYAQGFFQKLWSQLVSWEWLVAILGGMVWGWFGLVTLRSAFPPIGGLDRVGHREVLRLINAWFVVCVQRVALLVAYYTPLTLLIWWIATAFPAYQRLTLVMVAPLLGLLFRGWFLALVECAALYIDDRLVTGPATQDNPWHRDVKKYFQGYLNRTGWAVEDKLLDRLLFLPGKNRGVLCYGGGSIHPRILISIKLLHFTIGAPEEVAPESAFVPWPDWLAGAVLPHARNNPPPTHSPLVVRPFIALAKVFGFLRKPFFLRSSTRRSVRSRFARRKTLGQAATSLGYAVPFPPEELVPLIADGTEDFEIVRELLAEHYAWFEPDPADEYDDTDPTNRDCLFGALVREIGQIQREESQLNTLFKGIELRLQEGSAWMRKLQRALVGFYQRFFSRSPAILTDGYATLNFARHHLIQYLYYLG